MENTRKYMSFKIMQADRILVVFCVLCAIHCDLCGEIILTTKGTMDCTRGTKGEITINIFQESL